VRLVIQRVKESKVTVNGSTTGSIRSGLLVLIGIAREDTRAEVDYMLDKLLRLRIFPDDAGKMNRNIGESGGGMLLVSQFTLYGDTRGGRRPSYIEAARPEEASHLYDEFVRSVRALGVPVETGVFQAHMEVELVNDGPVTILLDSEKSI